MELNNIYKLYLANKLDEALHFINQHPPSAKLLNLKGLIFSKRQQLEDAKVTFIKSSKEDSNFTDPLLNLGYLFFEQKKYEDALSYFVKAKQINSCKGIADFYLAQICFIKNRDFGKIEEYLLEAINLDPLNNTFYNYLASFYFNNSNYKKAITFYKKSYQIKSDHFLLKVIAQAFSKLNLFRDSNYHYTEYLKYFKQDTEVYYLLAMNYLFENNKDLFWEYMNRCLAIDPAFERAIYVISRFKSKQIQINIADLEHWYDIEKHDVKKTNYGFALFNFFDQKKDYSKAANYLTAANNLVFNILNVNKYDDAKEFNIYKSIFTKEFFKNKIKSNNTAPMITPIFIVGLPRSGSTLLENILSFYKEIKSLGEIDYFYRSIQAYFGDLSLETLNYKINHSLHNQDFTTSICKHYLDLVGNHDCSHKFFTDKMLTNFRFIGFIKYCFPNAKIIHCTRNKSDNLFSIYSNHLGQESLPWIYDIELLKKYYNTYELLMRHWKDLFGNQIYELNYEAMVNDPTNTSKQLLSYLDLEWNYECLNNLNNTNPIKTASYDQAREQVYKHHLNYSKQYAEYIPELFN
jgi:tetratricopeptide (TPR) repeat protein/LPS sulfotransferase NodH